MYGLGGGNPSLPHLICMKDLTPHVLDYLGAGLHLLALGGKRPNPKYHASFSYEDSIHGVPETPDEMKALAAVFDDVTTTGVAILIPEHIHVADIDTDEAAALYLDLAGDYPDTPVAKTRNGLHVWFLSPGADASVWLGGRTLLLKGLGGYVVAPPSAHPDGGVYTWLTPLVADGMIRGIDYLPSKIADRLRFQSVISKMVRPFTQEESKHRIEGIRVGPGPWRLTDGTLRFEMTYHLEGLAKAIIEAPMHNQNNVIAWAAMTAQEEGVPFDVAFERLMDASRKGNHPAARARSTIRGAYKRRRNA